MGKRNFFCLILVILLLTADSAFAIKKTTLYKGCTGNDVTRLQQALIERRFLDGKADGVYGKKTENAVRNFQRAYGLNTDGMAGTRTLELLYQSKGTKSDSTSALRVGSRGDRVEALQKKLISLGYLGGTADGRYGAKTKEAVKYFQKRNGLSVDGVAGEKTLEVLSGKKAKSANEDKKSSKTSVELFLGKKGEEVTTLQQRLLALDYSVKVTGRYDNRTVEAVKAFQKRNDLGVDGIAGVKTLKKMYSSKARSAK